MIMRMCDDHVSDPRTMAYICIYICIYEYRYAANYLMSCQYWQSAGIVRLAIDDNYFIMADRRRDKMPNNLLTWPHCCQLTISRRSVLQVATYFQVPWLAHPKRQLSIKVNGSQNGSNNGDCTMIGSHKSV